ncbi:MAG: EAL domain-containing protein [Polaromonas sp.]|uniref:sensor domain-containing protein n=1 Tax=Polaromonas sp. TaxID=1869339 RepID=UPI0025E099F9|nr:EAL domain-containing protein [Polaromonas sp.]MBI2725612.1 EAL domain-containing protein [Polaromonas sp.]
MASPSAKEPFPPALQRLLERTSSSGVWTLEAGAAHVTASATLAELLGMDTPVEDGATHQMRLCDMLDFFADDSRTLMAARVDTCMTTGQAFDEEFQLDTTSGKRLWVRAVGQSLPDNTGGIAGMHGVLRDITGEKRAQNEAMGITVRLSTTLASIREAFVTVDPHGRFTYVNRESENLFKRRSDELLGRTLWNELDAQDTGLLSQEFNAMVAEGSGREFEHYCVSIDKWLALRTYAFEEGVAVYFRDVSSSRRSQEQLLLLETSISRLNDIVIITEAGPASEPGPRIVFVNDAFERHTGYSREEALGKTPRLLQGPATQRTQLNRIRTAMKYSQPVRAELINYRKNGELFWMELEIAPVDYFNRGLTHWVSIARDITERKAAEDKIEHLAFFDALTQLPNRQLLMDRLKKTLSQCEDSNTVGALMFIDLDNFKGLNDTLGHSRGDLLLIQAGLRLTACSRPEDTVARLGGDEFVVMLEDLGDSMASALAQTRNVGEKILAALSEPYELAGHQHHSTCSIGITLFSKHEQSIGDLLKQADLAMYQAKAAGRNGLCFFDPEMQAAATANATLAAELRQSLRQQDFVLHYQPQVGHKGMFGVEALVRWKHPRRGLVFPDAFIPQAEENGLIMPLGKWVLETACAQLARWALSPATAELSIAVNVSARQFRHPDFVDEVMSLISHTGIQASRLKLELTESLLASDVGVTVAKMVDLKKAGLTLSIDDFGMGYSALSYLKYLPLDQLKIDRTFVKDVLTDPNDAAIARTIIGLAQSLGLNVVAEGVETEAQRAWLEWFGCENYQGHLFCPALPIDELETFMHALSA